MWTVDSLKIKENVWEISFNATFLGYYWDNLQAPLSRAFSHVLRQCCNHGGEEEPSRWAEKKDTGWGGKEAEMTLTDEPVQGTSLNVHAAPVKAGLDEASDTSLKWVQWICGHGQEPISLAWSLIYWCSPYQYLIFHHSSAWELKLVARQPHWIGKSLEGHNVLDELKA